MSEKLVALICGGGGYIGGSFAYYLRQKRPEIEIVIIDDLSIGHHPFPELGTFYQCDVGDTPKVEQIIRKHSINIVFHFSAFSRVSESVENPLKYYANNVGNGVKLLQALANTGIKMLVFSSSAAVYGQPLPGRTPIDESHPTEPINPYGRTKLMLESIMSDFRQANPEFGFVSLRYFNVAGTVSPDFEYGESHMPESHLIPRVLDVPLGIRPAVLIYGDDFDTPDGTCIRDYIDMADLCEAHLLAMDFMRANPGNAQIINLGTATGTSVKEIIKAAEKVTGKSIQAQVIKRREGDPAKLIASNKKALEVLKWTPKMTLEATLQKAWKWHQVRDARNKKYNGFDVFELATDFRREFGIPSSDTEEWESDQPFRLFFAPGRINLIGEHTDYNGGLVFPATVNAGTYILARLNKKFEIRVRSKHFKEQLNIPLEEEFAQPKAVGDWRDYFAGAVYFLRQKYHFTTGFDAYIAGDLPMGAGLSSSASVSLAAINTVIGLLFPSNFAKNSLETVDLCKLAKRIENEIVGVNCGIMDQFIIGHGSPSTALVLNCNTLEFEAVPVDLGEFCFLLCNTNLERKLVTSKYNERFAECQEALAELNSQLPKSCLADYDSEEVEKVLSLLSDPVKKRRVRHVITENQRVKQAKEAFKNRDFIAFGKLLTESGKSLKEDYEVTGPHLDWMVESALACKGVFGARMMGGGFGGCAIALTKCSKVDEITSKIAELYLAKSGISGAFYRFTLGPKAGEIVF